jgi:hypothetical protein
VRAGVGCACTGSAGAASVEAGSVEAGSVGAGSVGAGGATPAGPAGTKTGRPGRRSPRRRVSDVSLGPDGMSPGGGVMNPGLSTRQL